MADKLIRNFTTTTTSPAADDYLALDGTTNNTRKILADKFATTANALLVANDLSDVNDAATSRDNLGVDSSDDLAESTGTKLVGPSLSFDGTDDFLEIADDDKLSFTSGTDDLPFSVSGWVKITDTGSTQIFLSKYGGTASSREYYVSVGGASDNALFRVYSQASSGYISVFTPASSLPMDSWAHVTYVYKGAGPNYDTSFASAYSDATQVFAIYINGISQTLTQSNSTGFSGMSNTGQPVYVGRDTAGNYLNGEIKQVQIFNRELSAAEVETVFRHGQLGFADQWGGALGGTYTQDTTPSGEWTVARGTDSDEAGPIDGRSNVLGFTVDTDPTNHYLLLSSVMTVGKKYRLELDYNVAAANDVVDGVRIYNGGYLDSAYTPTAGTWNRASIEFTASDASLRIYATSAGSVTVNDPGGDDIFYIDACTITQIGTLLDARASNFDVDTSKIYDISDNAFVGTSATPPAIVGRSLPVYTTGTWTPNITFGGGSTGITYSLQEGNYTRIGRIVYVSGFFVMTAKGTDTGAARINGLPFTAVNLGSQTESFVINRTVNMASLTSAVTGNVDDNAATVALFDHGATGSTAVDDTNFTNTSVLRFSGTYQIQ